MSNLTVPSLVRLHGVERSDRVATYVQVADIIARARQALFYEGMPATPNSPVGALFAQADRLDREWEAGAPSDDIETLMLADEAARIADAVLEAIKQPDSRESIRRITISDMRLSTRQPSQGKDALWELDLMLFLRRRGAAVVFKDPPDLELSLPGLTTPYGIACKKVYSEKSLNRQFSKGLKQLLPYAGAGLVAFNLDDLTPERSILQASARQDASDHLHQLNVAFIERHRRQFQKAVVAGRCDGIWIWSCVHADVRGLSPRFNRITESTIWRLSSADHGAQSRIGKLKSVLDASRGPSG
jgi:hypothetical protein